MGTFTRTTTYPITLSNGQTIDATVTYTATYKDTPNDPGITKHEFMIEPCDLVGSPQLDARKSQMRPLQTPIIPLMR